LRRPQDAHHALQVIGNHVAELVIEYVDIVGNAVFVQEWKRDWNSAPLSVWMTSTRKGAALPTLSVERWLKDGR
jgi:hypothetical protein